MKRAILSASLLVLAGCDLGVSDGAKELREAVEVASAALEKSSDTVALSVPGEEYRRMIATGFDGTPEERQKLLDGWTRILGTSPEAQYNIDTTVSFDESAYPDFVANTRMIDSPDFYRVQSICPGDETLPMQAIVSSGLRQITESELYEHLDHEIRAALHSLAIDATGEEQFSYSTRGNAFGPPNSYIRELTGQYANPRVRTITNYSLRSVEARGTPPTVEDWDDIAARRDAASDRITKAILQTIRQSPIPTGDASLKEEFSFARGRPYLLFFMPIEQLTGHDSDNFSIEVVARSRSNENVTLGNEGVIRIPYEDIKANSEKPIICGPTDRELAWAVVDVTQNVLLSQEMLDMVIAMRRVIDEYDDANR